MLQSVTTNTRRPRLNPLPFPSDIALRFDLLIVLIVCVSIQFYGHFWESLHVEATEKLVACASDMFAGVFDPRLLTRDVLSASEMRVQFAPQFAHCMALLRPQMAWKGAGIVATLALASVFYWCFPAWKLKSQRLVPIAKDDPPGLFDALIALCGEAQLNPPPAFVWNPLATGLPVTFGRRRDYYVALSGAFVANYFYADRAAFRAIVLHELAHIRNRDIDKTFMTIAACFAFVIVSVVPLLGVALFAGHALRDTAWLLAKTGLWSALVLLSGASVLRVREFYADVQASQWDGSPVHVDRVLARMRDDSNKRARTFLSLHPRGDARRAVLADTTPLFRLGKWDALGIGFGAGVVIETMNGLVLGLVPGEAQAAVLRVTIIASAVVPLAVMIFAIGALTTGVWRGAYAAVLNGRDPVKGTAAAGAVFALGYFVNQMLLGAGLLWGGPAQPRMTADTLTTVLEVHAVALVLAAIGCWMICDWIARSAAAWTGVAVRSRSPLFALRLTSAVSIAGVAGMFAWGTFASMSIVTLGPHQTFYTSLVMAAPPVVIAAFGSWLFPWASRWFGRARRELAPSSWVFVDDAFRLRLPEFRPGRALSTGIIAGLVFCLWIELLRFRRFLPHDAESTIYATFSALLHVAQRAGESGFAIVMPIALTAALAALIAASRRGAFNALYGLCAGSIAGAVMSVGGLVTIDLNAQSTFESSMTSVLLYLGVASLAALPASMIGALAGKLGRSSDGHDRLLMVRKAVVAMLGIVVIAGWIKSLSDVI
ncbi:MULTISPECIES: M48 family metalloprotease [unclassified Caballeronia]|uniref:M48 family metalloprotease n=1 Tax=unclassified Caballeronia TaxID=2646786 RepID=UPI0020297AC1|nr:M48 family metalloprotease [Caballeronia sp. LZ028]MDR5769510.1 M48 family metalloprotease [Caballeronia sp. LZ028]